MRRHPGEKLPYTAVCLLASICFAGPALASGDRMKQTIVRFFELREKTLDQRGTKEDVGQLLRLFAPDGKYEHPGAGIVMGVEQARSGLIAHLNEGSDATIHFDKARMEKAFAVVESTLHYTVEGKPVTRHGVAVFEFSKGKIVRLAEY